MCVCIDLFYLQLVNVASLNLTIHMLQFLLLADVNVTQLMHTCHNLCVRTLKNVAYRCQTSLAKCAQTTLNVWTPALMVPIFGRHCLVDACIILWWCFLPLIDIFLLMPAGHDIYHCFDVITPWVVHALIGCSYTPLVDVALLMHVGHQRCNLAKALRARLKSHSWCAQNIIDV